MKNIKYIFSDIDGTLIFKDPSTNGIVVPEESRYISQQTIDVLNRIRSQGVKVILVSGRRKSSYERVASLIPHDGALIEHGSVILYKEDIDREYADVLKKDIEQLWKFKELLESRQYQIDITGRVASFRIKQMHGSDLNEEQEFELEKFIKENTAKYGITLTRNESMIDVIPLAAGKANAIMFILNRHNISLENCVMLGNDVNDVSMFKIATYAACPGDSSPEVIDLLRHNTEAFISKKTSHESILDILENYISAKEIILTTKY